MSEKNEQPKNTAFGKLMSNGGQKIADEAQAAAVHDFTGEEKITTVPAEIFNNNLPEGLTLEQIAAAKNYESTYAPAAIYGAGRAVLGEMVKDPDLNKVKIIAEMHGRDTAEAVITGKEEFTIGDNKSVVHGGTLVKIRNWAAENSIGAMGAVRKQLKIEGEELLKK